MDLPLLIFWCAPLIVLGVALLWWGARERRSKRRR
jgi:cytochrome c-type biogenesis protein CcmH/NrfF